MRCRAKRKTKRLASVAVIANCHFGSPNRSVKLFATHCASAVGNIVVNPRCNWAPTASASAETACPVIAPVSPRQKSIYETPSTHENDPPLAASTYIGKAPGQRTIQGIGTPDSKPFCASCARRCDLGCLAAKSASSCAIALESRSRSKVPPTVTVLLIPTGQLKSLHCICAC